MYNLYERMSVLTPNEKRWHMSSLIFKKDNSNKKVCYVSAISPNKKSTTSVNKFHHLSQIDFIISVTFIFIYFIEDEHDILSIEPI